MSLISGKSSHELSVSCAWIQSTPSLEENRQTRPSSIDTSANCGLGRAIRASPSSASSKPSPTEMATTATPSTRAKLLKLMPAANQNWPCLMGKVSLYCCRTAIGSDGGV